MTDLDLDRSYLCLQSNHPGIEEHHANAPRLSARSINMGREDTRRADLGGFVPGSWGPYHDRYNISQPVRQSRSAAVG